MASDFVKNLTDAMVEYGAMNGHMLDLPGGLLQCLFNENPAENQIRQIYDLNDPRLRPFVEEWVKRNLTLAEKWVKKNRVAA